LPQFFASARVESNSASLSCDCLARSSGMTEAERRVVRPLLPVPAWLLAGSVA
jgi:hypothetical protein